MWKLAKVDIYLSRKTNFVRSLLAIIIRVFVYKGFYAKKVLGCGHEALKVMVSLKRFTGDYSVRGVK